MTMLPGRIWRESEFFFTNREGKAVTGACGPNGTAMAVSWAKQAYTSTGEVYHRMRDATLCDANGVSTIAGCAEGARREGVRVGSEAAYREPWPDWRQWLDTRAGRQAVVLEVANGQALIDRVSGSGENARDLRYHILLVAGVDERGYWCADGANRAVGNVLQLYPHDVLGAARPCGAYAVLLNEGVTPVGGVTDGPVDVEGLGSGFADMARRMRLAGEHTPEVDMNGWTVAAWPDAEGGVIMTYAEGRGVTVHRGGGAWALYHVLTRLERDRAALARVREIAAALRKAVE